MLPDLEGRAWLLGSCLVRPTLSTTSSSLLAARAAIVVDTFQHMVGSVLCPQINIMACVGLWPCLAVTMNLRTFGKYTSLKVTVIQNAGERLSERCTDRMYSTSVNIYLTNGFSIYGNGEQGITCTSAEHSLSPWRLCGNLSKTVHLLFRELTDDLIKYFWKISSVMPSR